MMKIPTKFKGKIYFYWHTKFKFFLYGFGVDSFSDQDDVIYLGASDEIEVEFSERSESHE